MPPADVAKYRAAVDEVWKLCLIDLLVPVGYARPRGRKGFGELPPPAGGPPMLNRPRPGVDPTDANPDAPAGEPALAAAGGKLPSQPIAFVTPEIPSGRRSRPREQPDGEDHPRQPRRPVSPITMAVIVIGIILALLGLFFVVSFTVVLASLLADLAYAAIDPRIRLR